MDIEARCQVFRVCAHTDTSGIGFTFLCPNGTLFNQHVMVCDWYYNVVCNESDAFYNMNQVLGMKDGTDEKIREEVVKMITFPFNQRKNKITEKINNLSNVDRFSSNRQNISQFKSRPQSATKDPNFEVIQSPAFTGNGDNQGIVSVVPSKSPIIAERNEKEVFISNLGELSTDANSLFDPVKSKIIQLPVKRVIPTKNDPSTRELAGRQLVTYPKNVVMNFYYRNFFF